MNTNHWTETIFASEPMKIGKKEWRVIVYYDAYHQTNLTSYQFRTPEFPEFLQEPSNWQDMTEWPRYNHNDGMYAGCPKTLVKLYEQNKPQIMKAIK